MLDKASIGILVVLISSSAGARTYHGVSFCSDGQNAWVVSTQRHILHSTDGGWNWEEQTSGTIYNIYDVHFVDSSEGWTGGLLGEVLHTMNGGDTWSRQAIGLAKMYVRMFFLNESYGWAGGEGVIGLTTNGGENWGQIFLDPYYDSTICYGVSFVNQLEGWLSAGIPDSLPEQGCIFHTTDGGYNWSLELRDTTHDFLDIGFWDSQTGWAVGGSDATYDPVILRTTDGGGSWLPQTAPGGSYYLRSVQFTDELEGWAVGRFGTIIHTTNGGSTWGSQFYPTQATLFDLSFVDSERGIVVGDSSIILVTTNGGANWINTAPGVGERTIANDQLPMTKSQLSQNSPNPFAHSTLIIYSLPPRRGDAETRGGGDVSTYDHINLSVYDLGGRLVKMLIDESLPASYSLLPTWVLWDGRDERGGEVPPGVYFYRLSLENLGLNFSKKMVKIR